MTNESTNQPDSRTYLTLEFPIPSKELRRLSPNGGTRWQVLAGTKRTWRGRAKKKAELALRALESEDEIIFTGYDIIRFKSRNSVTDQDNLLASLKCVLDGIAEGLGVNDSTLNAGSISFAIDPENPRITIFVFYEKI